MKTEARFGVYLGNERLMDRGIQIMPLPDFLTALAAGKVLAA